MTYFYRIVAGSYEYCPEVQLVHENSFTKEELDSLLEQAEVSYFTKKWPEILEEWKWGYENNLKRVSHMQEEYPDTDWATYFRKKYENESERYESHFEEIIEELCTKFGFSEIKYTALVTRGAWDDIHAVVRCELCGKDKLSGSKFHDAPLNHNCI